MPIIEGTPDITDIMSLQRSQIYSGDIVPPVGQNVLDANSPEYNPNLIPKDLSTGESIVNPEDGQHLSIWDVAKDDWVTTKLVDWAARQAFEDDPNFERPWGDLPEQYDPYIAAFEDVRSKKEWDYVKYRIDQSLAADKYMKTAGVKDGAAYFGVQMLDPVLAPLYLVNLPFSVAGKGTSSGRAMLQTGLRTGAYTTAETAVIEGVLQATDPTRTFDESLTTIGASAIMGSLFGVAGQAVISKWGRKAEQAHQEIKDTLEAAVIAHRAGEDTAGALSIRPTLEGERPLANPTRFLTLRSPTFRLLYDRVSASASAAVDRLVPHNVFKAKHLRGGAEPEMPLYSRIMQERERGTSSMVLAVKEAKKALRRNGIRLSDDEIGTLIGKAARRGDVPDYPELQPAVDKFRNIMDEWGSRAVRAGIVTEEALQEIASYFPRLYDVRKISKNMGRWSEVIINHFRQKYPDMLEAELQLIPISIHNQLRQVPVNQMHIGGFKVPTKVLNSGHLKARTLDISDLDLEEFLVDDARYVTQHYLRSMTPAVLAREIFGPEDIQMVDGYPVIQSILNDIDMDYANAIARNKEKAASLTKERDRAIGDMKYLMSSVLGWGNPHQGMVPDAQWARIASSEMRSFTAAAGLGGMVVAAIADLANLVLDHGLTNLIRSLPAIATPRKWSNSAKADFDAMAIGLDTLLSTRMLRMADLEDRSWNAFTRGIGGQQIATGSFKVFGANLWNSWMKRAAAVAAQNRILSDSLRYAKLSKIRKAKLASLGIDEATANRFAENFSRQSVKKRQGINWADTSNWDEVAASKFEQVLFRDVETTIVTPQAGDMPKVLDNGVGLMVAQFKRFVMSHQIQIMTQASQRLAAGDLAVLNYIVAMTGLGLFSEYSRILIKSGFDADKANKEFEKYTPSDLVFKAIDRSAGLSFGTDMLMGIDGLTDGKTGQMLGFSDKARYSPSGLGLESRIPSLGYMNKGARVVKAGISDFVGSDEFNKKDLHALRQMIPMQNTFYLAWLFDQLEETIADTFNLPEGGNAKGSKRYAQ